MLLALRRRQSGRAAALGSKSRTLTAPLLKAPKGALAPQPVIYVAIFLHLLGFTMTGPVLPALREHFELSAARTGLITSAFPLGMFAAVFLFPALSDVLGRKPMLLVSYIGVGVLLILQGVAVYGNLSFETFLMLRFFCGTFAGASTVVKAYIADMSSPENLPQSMAYRESAATLAFIVGPIIGGVVLSNGNLQAILVLQGVASILAGAVVALLLRRLPARAPHAQTVKRSPATAKGGSLAADGSRGEGSSCTSWAPLVITMALSCSYNFGQSFFDAFFAVHCADRLALGASAIGAAQTAMALIVLLVAAGFYGVTVRRLGLVETAALGLLLIGLGLGASGGAGSPPWLAVGVLFYAVGVPLFSPTVATMLSRGAPAHRRGFVLGADSAVNCVARVLSPVLLGAVYEASPVRAFGFVAVGAFLGSALAVAHRRALAAATAAVA